MLKTDLITISAFTKKFELADVENFNRYFIKNKT